MDIKVDSVILSAFCVVSIIGGVVVLLRFQSLNILHRYTLEIIGLTFLAPFVLLLAFFSLISSDAAGSLAGAMVGYFFRAGTTGGPKARGAPADLSPD